MRQTVTLGGGGKAILLYCTNDQCLDDLCGVRMSREPLPDGLLKNHLHCALGQHRAEPKGLDRSCGCKAVAMTLDSLKKAV